MPEPGAVFTAEEQRVRAIFAQRRNDPRYTWSNPAHVFMMQSLERRLLTLLARNGMSRLSGKRVLEIGCGTGHWLREFVKWGAHPQDVVGVDLLSDRVREARELSGEGAHLFCGSAANLPLRDEAFDLVAQFTVFTSILDVDLRRHVALEMLRVTKPDGLILWYDFFYDNPKNRDVRGVRQREIRGLFAGCSVRVRKVTLAPPLTRRLAPRAPWLCSILEAVPMLRTHYLGVIKREP